MTLAAVGKPTPLPVECDRVTCLRTGPDGVAVLQPNRTVWAAWAGQPGKLLDRSALPDNAGELWARGQIALFPLRCSRRIRAVVRQRAHRHPIAPAGHDLA